MMNKQEKKALTQAIKKEVYPSDIDPNLKRSTSIDYIYEYGTYPPTQEGVYSYEEDGEQHIVFLD